MKFIQQNVFIIKESQIRIQQHPNQDKKIINNMTISNNNQLYVAHPFWKNINNIITLLKEIQKLMKQLLNMKIMLRCDILNLLVILIYFLWDNKIILFMIYVLLALEIKISFYCVSMIFINNSNSIEFLQLLPIKLLNIKSQIYLGQDFAVVQQNFESDLWQQVTFGPD